MAPETVNPKFRDLDAKEANDLLARNHIGRIAYSFHNRVDIEPISYVFADGALYMRTTPGSKLLTLAHAPWAAFEVDEIAGPFDWQSVVVHGTVYVLEDAGSREARAAYAAAVERIRELNADAFGHEDPTPMRRVVVKLYPETITGREARATASAQATKRPTHKTAR